MDRAYEGENMRRKALEKGYSPVVPPKSNRKNPWEYDKERYKQRNQIERYFLRLKRFRRIFTRYDKLDMLFCGFIYFAMIVDAICNLVRTHSSDRMLTLEKARVALENAQHEQEKIRERREEREL